MESYGVLFLVSVSPSFFISKSCFEVMRRYFEEIERYKLSLTIYRSLKCLGVTENVSIIMLLDESYRPMQHQELR